MSTTNNNNKRGKKIDKTVNKNWRGPVEYSDNLCLLTLFLDSRLRNSNFLNACKCFFLL